MEPLIALISVLSTVIFSFALIITIRISRIHLDRASTVLLIASISIFLVNCGSDIFEYTGITDAFDSVEDYLDIIFDPLFIFFIYSYLSWQERNKTEKARDELEESEARYRVLSEATFEGIGIAERGIIIDANLQMAEMLGYDLDELIGIDLKKTIAPEDWEIIKKHREERYDGIYNHGALKKDGTVITIEVRDKDIVYKGRTVRQTVMRDITERKKAEDELRTSNTLLDNIFSSTDYLLAYLDREFNFINVNQAYADAGGKHRDYFIGRNHFNLYPHEENETIFREVLRTGKPFRISETPFEYPDQPERGTTFWDWSLVPVKDETGAVKNLVFSLNDVTEKVKIQLALRDSEERFRLAFENASIGSCITGIDSKFIEVNERLCKMLGYSEQELIGKTFNELTHPDDIRLSSEQMKSMLTGNMVQSTFEKRYINKDGSYIWALVSPSLLRDHNNNPMCFITYVQDITDRRQAEEEIRLHSDILSRMAEGVMMSRASDGLIIYTNPTFEQLFGCGPGQLLNRHVSVLNAKGEKDPEEVAEDIIHDLEEFGMWAGEVQNIRADRTTFWSYASVTTFKHHEYGDVWITVQQDITERKQAERLLKLDEARLEALLDLYDKPSLSENEIAFNALEHMLNLTESNIGYIGSVDEAQQIMTVYSWSKSVIEECAVEGRPLDFLIERAGIWAEVIRKREIIMINDYAEQNPLKKGLPEGHVPLERFLSIPVIDDDKVVLVASVGNKEDNYNFSDVRQINLFVSGIWKHLELKRAEEKLAAMSMELSMTEERERRNIASDLHDHIAQALAMTKVKLGEVSSQMSGDSVAKLEAIKAEVDRIINNTRSLIFDLSPPVLYELGFKEAVEWIAERIQRDNGIQIIVMAGSQYVQIDQEIRVILFKAVRELLMNVIKHAKADTVEVIISDLRGNIHVQVKDDGVGFEVSKINSNLKENSFGILNLTERIKYIGGTVEVASEPGEGTTVKIKAPLTSELKE